ncbi:MAG TPA: glycerophosphodiester phosphodiesterase [Mycobacterium sp.]|nr:glycerophosphodiester phosphodiesterase [Mycobacterium sp.]
MASADGVLAGHPYVVAHRGASVECPEHTLAAYDLALKEGADGVECDVRLTRDGHLVCVHDRRVDRTSTGVGLVSELTLAQLRELDYGAWHSSRQSGDGQTRDTGLLTLDALVSLVLDWHRPVKIFIETKHPVRYGALVERKVLALLQQFGIAAPASADRSRAVVMSFSAAAVWRIRRAAPLLPTVLLGAAASKLRGSAATVGATAIGPSLATLREYPQLVDRAAAQGRAVYCWTADRLEDVAFCRDVGVAWIATNYPARTKAWLRGGQTGAGRD